MVGIRAAVMVAGLTLLAASGGPQAAAASTSPWPAGRITALPDPRLPFQWRAVVTPSVGTPSGDAWAVVGGSLMRWQNGGWQSVAVPNGGSDAIDVFSVAADGSGDVVAEATRWNWGPPDPDTGDATKVDLEYVLLRWNGAGFDELPAPPEALRQLFVLGPIVLREPRRPTFGSSTRPAGTIWLRPPACSRTIGLLPLLTTYGCRAAVRPVASRRMARRRWWRTGTARPGQ
jgi:hypothetical protein